MLEPWTLYFVRLAWRNSIGFDHVKPLKTYGILVFTDIINDLSSLGKEYTTSEMVRKILRSLPKQWEAKVTAIQEAKDLSKLPLDELIGSLMTHEITMNQNLEDVVKTEKEKNLAFSSSTSYDDVEKDIAFLAKKFKFFFETW